MTNDDYKRVVATFPWRHEVQRTTKGALIKLLDKNGDEVPLTDLMHFMEFITGRIANKGGA